MKTKKVKECLNRMCRIFGISIRKATSYKVVKGRLNYRWYNDDMLQERHHRQLEEI